MSFFGNNTDLFLLPSKGDETTRIQYGVPMMYIYFLALIGNVGIILNIVNLIVWSSEPNYVPSTYLFKTLAVSDILYMATWFPFYFNKAGNRFVRFFLNTLCFGNRKFGLLVTLILSVVRFIILFYPESVTRLLSRVRIKAVVIIMMTYCFWLQGLSCGYYIVGGIDEQNYSWRTIPRKILPYLVPSTLQIVLMMIVVWKIEYEAKRSTRIQEHESGPNSSTNAESSKLAMRRIIYVVLAMCVVMSFVAYEISTVLNVLFTEIELLDRYRNYITMGVNYTCFINSSINFFFYLFINRFRLTFLARFDIFKRNMQEFSWAPAYPVSEAPSGREPKPEEDLGEISGMRGANEPPPTSTHIP